MLGCENNNQQNGNDARILKKPNTRDELFERFFYNYQQKNWKEFRKISDNLVSESERADDFKNLARTYRYLAAYHKNISQFDSAFFYYTKSEKNYRKINDVSNLSNILLNKSVVQFYAGDNVGADRTITEAYSAISASGDYQKEYEVNAMMGLIANELKDYDRAIQYNLKALQIVRKHKLNSNYEEIICLNNIGYSYLKLGKHPRAIEYFEQGLREKNLKLKVPDLYSLLIDNLAYSRFKTNNKNGLPDLFYEALEIRKNNDERSLIVLSYVHLSEFFEGVKDNQAKEYAELALEVARKNRNPVDIWTALKQLTSIDAASSSKYTDEYMRMHDSLTEVQRNSQEKFARLQLDTDQISMENDKLAEQNRNLLYFFVGSLMIGLLLFVIRTQRAKNRELMLKQAQQKANEDIYNLMISQQNMIEESRIKEKKRIAQELHDGVLGRLFGTRLNLDSLNRMTDEESLARRGAYLAELKNIEQDIREISHDLNREKYALINNFLAILNNLLEEQRTSFDTSIESIIDTEINWDLIENNLKINLYRILQESLQNINKYANATRIKIKISEVNNTIFLTVVDDGVGFDVDLRKKGIGLQNMLARANELDGTFEIKSKKGKGTTLSVSFPTGKSINR